ncbi:hypothetical protein ACFL59_08955 [Planctomycetota bacterium]
MKQAVLDGMWDYEHLNADQDLVSLHGYEPFEALRQGGQTQHVLGDMTPGQVVELEMPEPLGILALGAFVAEEPWEGWATTLAAAEIHPTLEVPTSATPGEEITVRVNTGDSAPWASVYLVLKDARLLTPDTPTSRLAGQMKRCVERTAGELEVGAPNHSRSLTCPASCTARTRRSEAHTRPAGPGGCVSP